MAVKVGINGFGRIGRLVVRAAKKRGADVDFVAVNDVTDAPTLAHLLQYDSVHGTWPEPVCAEGESIRIGDDTIRVLKEKDPAKLPWKSLGVDVVVESTGLFTDKEKAAAQGVKHDDMNVLCLGARVIGPELATALIKSFLGAHYLGTEPGGERLARRVEKIRKLENG